MIRGPTAKQQARKIAKKKQQKLEYEKRKAKRIAMEQAQNTDKSNETTCPNTDTNIVKSEAVVDTIKTVKKDDSNHSMQEQKESEVEMKNNEITSDTKTTPMIMGKEIQKMNQLSRLPNELFASYIERVRKTTSYFLNEKKHKHIQAKLRRRQRNREKKLRREERQIEAKRLLKLEHKKQRKEQRAFERKIKPQKEHIPFGATNERPPVDLHKLGTELFGKRVHNKSNRNENNLNVGSLTFANVIKGRAQQLKQQEVRRNYALMKQKRYAKMKRNTGKPKRKVW